MRNKPKDFTHMKEERIITPTEIRFDKTQCGVDFLLNTGPGYEHASHYTSEQDYITDYFEFLFLKRMQELCK